VRLESASEIVKSLNLNSLSSRFDGTHDKVIEQQFSISGGEKQRIGLGRALYRNPTLLVLDEATSSLDGETEQQIMKVLTDLPKETAIISIAHRITTIRNADVILFMKEGKISNTGNFEELIAASWEFSELVRLSTLN
jgi:ABC-type multidrug transport system fused ATPase/permease subunit